MESEEWWDKLTLVDKKEMVSKYLLENRTINFLTQKDIRVMYEGNSKDCLN